MCAVQLGGQRLQPSLSGQRTLSMVGITHSTLYQRLELLGQLVDHIPDLVKLTPPDHGVIKNILDRAVQRLRTVDHRQDRASDIQAALA